MKPEHFWIGVLLVGGVIGMVATPMGAFLTIVGLLAVSVAGLVAAAFLGWLQQEWLLLLMGAGPAAALAFAAAAVSWTIAGGIKKIAAWRRRHLRRD